MIPKSGTGSGARSRSGRNARSAAVELKGSRDFFGRSRHVPLPPQTDVPAERGSAFLGFRLLGQHLPAAIHAGLEIDVVRPAQFAGILVFDISRTRERVGRAAPAAPRR